MDRWNKAGFRETRDSKSGRKSTKSRRVKGSIGGGKNS
jgi:ribosomal protein L34